MPASRVVFRSEGYGIEGRLAIGGERAVVVTHPHPLYGGDMDNDVVTAITEAFAQAGYTTLRFNFRGIGRSEGRYSEGLGEQEDVCAAVDHLRGCGYADVELSGYSFGTWVNALCAGSRLPDIPMTMVAPPAAFMDFGAVSDLPGLKAVLTGSRDDIAPPDMLKRLTALWNPEARLEILTGADHFFFGYREALISLLVGLIRDRAAGGAAARIS
ncbi:MAG: alpha/beta hydrolase [Desulfobacterales bacterium]|nr:alpha/beta hydrolase [Desulfobacterales bacterium]MDJ0855601.1 alpha/beta hydrolase [Desulfobacterales bacterium]MDJ0887998.1 alpha/beta hydrolase [Desulfobacterales bacterium]MDJ0990254.1 alpha/beta hydrolase [Desulfobacterales bacterium]